MLLFLLGVALCSTNYSALNASFGWPGYQVNNLAAFPINTPPTLPYQIIEDVSPFSMNGYFNFSNNAAQYVRARGIQMFQNIVENQINLRADSDEVNTRHLVFPTPIGNAQVNAGSTWHSLYHKFHYRKQITANRTVVNYFLVLQMAASIGPCLNISSSTTIGGVTWNLGYQSYGCCMTLSGATLNYSGSINLANFGAYLISVGQLSPYDTLVSYSVEFWLWGAGRFSFTLSSPAPPTRKITATGLVVIGNWTLHSLQYVPDAFVSDYINITYLSASTSLSTLVTDFFYTRSLLNAYPRAYLGYADGTWFTTSGTYDLPISAKNQTVQLVANFSYSQADTIAAGKAACIGLVLRNDYNVITGVFANASNPNPAAEVEVCTWWSAGLPRNGSLGNVTLNSSYELCSQTAISDYNASSWPTYIFIANANSLSVVDIDLMAFVRTVASNVTQLVGYYVTGVYFGFRIYYGKGQFTYVSDPSLQVYNQVVPPTNTTNNLTNQSYSTNQSPQFLPNTITLNIIKTISETPNVMLIVKSIKPVLFIIQEYSYFLLLTRKNVEAKAFYQFCFNATWRKWQPSYIASIPALHSPLFNALATNDYNRTPATLSEQAESLLFVANTEHYWRTYIPITILMHFGLMLLWKLLCCSSLRSLLKVFSVVSPLLWALCCQNVQYLSFRAFLQLLAPTATTRGELFNLVLCLVTLFLTIVLSLSLPILLKKKVISMVLSHLKPRGIWFHLHLVAWTLTRTAMGFCHSFLNNNCGLQLCLMLLVEVFYLCSLLFAQSVFLSTSVYCCTFTKQLLKTIFLFALILEFYLTEGESLKMTDAFANIEMAIIGAILVMSLIQFIVRLVGLRSHTASRNQAKEELEPTKKKVTIKGSESCAGNIARITVQNCTEELQSNIGVERHNTSNEKSQASTFKPLKIGAVQRQKLLKLRLLDCRLTK